MIKERYYALKMMFIHPYMTYPVETNYTASMWADRLGHGMKEKEFIELVESDERFMKHFKETTTDESDSTAFLVGAVSGSAFSPQEFRIGNYVTSKSWFGKHKIEGIEILENRIDFKVKGYIHSIVEGQCFDLDKIPINNEVLEEFGFVRDLELEKLERGRYLQFSIGDRKTSIFFRICYHPVGGYTFSYRGNPVVKLIYLHQLQNVYYLMSGEELTLS